MWITQNCDVFDVLVDEMNISVKRKKSIQNIFMTDKKFI